MAGKGAHQHQQRRLGQVEIGDQRIHHAKRYAGVDEDRVSPLERLQEPTLRRALQCAQRWWCRPPPPARHAAGCAPPARPAPRDTSIDSAVHAMLIELASTRTG
jgi:hypothetical protein